ncbi:MAG: DNA repair protein RadA [Deltaproteobacteria bacterium]|nr:DNA repair protein RadA [Deltaproteobacteria bacterium]
MKNKTVFACQNCGAQFPKWMGKCPDCQQWNTLVEEAYAEQPATAAQAKGHAAFRQSLRDDSAENRPFRLDEIEEKEGFRFPTAYAELNRVLGGGVVPGSLVLIGGDPGIGKSTILMQGFTGLKELRDRPILYVSGEESAKQIKLRAARLGMKDSNFLVHAENSFEAILETVQKVKPAILIVDSIQTVFSTQVQSAPGSVSQVRECTARLMVTAKTLGVATFLVGHVTKDGSIAGPKVLEHMVDTVLYFEGATHNAYRILRAVKNRFGSTNEIGVFEMTQAGLREVTNPSEIFLQERPVNAAGTVVVSAIEGSRPILVEVQALVSSSNLATPRRTTLGIDHNKVSLLIAVIEKKLGLPLYGHDIFVNVAGGIRLDEPGADLGAALALASSHRNKPLNPKLLVCGEVGLTGEVRRVSQLDLRLSEAEKLGFESAIVPKSSLEALEKSGFKPRKLEIHGVRTLGEAVERVLS